MPTMWIRTSFLEKEDEFQRRPPKNSKNRSFEEKWDVKRRILKSTDVINKNYASSI